MDFEQDAMVILTKSQIVQLFSYIQISDEYRAMKKQISDEENEIKKQNNKEFWEQMEKNLKDVMVQLSDAMTPKPLEEVVLEKALEKAYPFTDHRTGLQFVGSIQKGVVEYTFCKDEKQTYWYKKNIKP